MLKLRKTEPGEPLIVSMTGLRLGDRVLIVGCAQPRPIALLAAKPGLTGRMCVLDETAERTARGAAAAEREGALVEAETAPVTMLPFEGAAFDVTIVNHLLPLLAEDRRVPCLQEALRVLRPGGRCIAIEAARRSGLAGLLGGSAGVPHDEVEHAMQRAGFSGVRTLAERDGLLFVEGARKK